MTLSRNTLLAVIFSTSIVYTAIHPATALGATPGAFAKEMRVGAKTLVLNGTGVRKATLFKVKVYTAGLYLETKSGDAEQILKSASVKRIELRFMRDVGADKMRGAWDESFEKNCELPKECEPLKPKLETLKSWMQDLHEGDILAFNFFKDGVEVLVQNERKGVISDPAFARLLLTTWLGKHPPNDDLKDGMLGR